MCGNCYSNPVHIGSDKFETWKIYNGVYIGTKSDFVDIRPDETSEHKSLKIIPPFPKEEMDILNLLVDAHNAMFALERQTSNEIQEWTMHLHALQQLIMVRQVRRLYSNEFNTVNGEKVGRYERK